MNTNHQLTPVAVGRLPAFMRFAGAVMASLLLTVATGARAQAPDVDPPGRVARLSDVAGQVWLFNADANEWIGVARNRPITGGDRIATDNGARAEIALGTTTLRLDAASELEVVQLDDARFVVHLHRGSAAARLRSGSAAAEFELDTDEGRFRAQTAGRYRFDRFDQSSDLTVLNGQAVFEGRNSALPLTTGQHAQFWLDGSGAPQYSMMQPAHDAFASYVDERDRAEDRVAAVRYVSPEMTGAEDLDRYGQWEQSPDYGAIWYPAAVPTGWAPYSAGHWAFVRPWGWTWVDDAPWGFAPFHYGRWVRYRERWCWAPGTYTARPVYAPALVAWVGGSRTSVSISIGGGRGGPPVGWFPLAPREVYVPSYRSSPTYVRNVNVTQVTNVTQITTIINNRNGEGDRRDFANRRFPGAVTVVPASVMTGRQPVGPSAAQFRNDPQVRDFMGGGGGGRNVAAVTQPPVAAPIPSARPPEGRGLPRPPFEGRPPGSFGGRGDPGRPEGGRADRDGGRGDRDGGRADRDGGRADRDGGRPDRDGGRPGRDGGRPDRADAGRPDGGRSDGRVPDRGNVPAAPAVTGVAPAPATAAPVAVPRPPVAGRDETPIGRPPRGGVAREPAAVDAPTAPQRVLPPSPRLRGGEAPSGDERPGARPAGTPPPGGVPRMDPRGAEPMRGVEPQRPPPQVRVTPEAPRVAPIQPVQRAAEPPKSAEPAPKAPEVQRAPPESRQGRGEQRPREERREDRREPKGDQPDKR